MLYKFACDSETYCSESLTMNATLILFLGSVFCSATLTYSAILTYNDALVIGRNNPFILTKNAFYLRMCCMGGCSINSHNNPDRIMYYGPQREKTCLRGFANNTGADQPAHPRSLISAFVVRFLESIICKLTTGKILIF